MLKDSQILIPKSLTANNYQLPHTTFFTNSLAELIASTTSLNAITRAPKLGVRKPNAATGMAIML